MRGLFDVNFLLALFDSSHLHYQRALAWWNAHPGHGWATCPLTENGFVRVISQRRYPKPKPAADAIEALRLQAASSDHAFWSDEISISDPAIFDKNRILGPNQITDVYLLGLAVVNNGRLVTFDQSIPLAVVRGAEARHLAVV